MSTPDAAATSEPAPRMYTRPPLTIGGWSLFDKVRYRWGGAGDILLGICLVVGVHSAGGIIFGLLFIMLGIATWIFTNFGRGRGSLATDQDPGGWYTAWNSMSTNGRIIAGVGSVIGYLFFVVLFFWFFIIRLVWKHIVAPGLRT
jgi:hypothetical protein